MEWQPIETAPKDGTRVLVYDKADDEILVCYWYDKWELVYGGYVPDESVTHWMPLPEAPNA